MQSYLITDRVFYTDTAAVFRTILHERFRKYLPDFALYRDKNNPHYANQAEHFLEVCAQFQDVKGILHADVALAHQLHAYGVHLTSRQFDKIEEAKKLGLFVIVSTHSETDILEVKTLGADAITYSPIFSTPNKGNPKGLADLKDIVGKMDIKIFALGGITTEDQKRAVEATGVYGFASIRYFTKNI